MTMYSICWHHWQWLHGYDSQTGPMQAWALIEVCFGHGEKYSLEALNEIIITDKEHRLRSDKAEEVIAEGVAKYPLHPAAANGGRPGADPNSKVEILLSTGEHAFAGSSSCMEQYMH